jgi:hypothetical protein
LKIENINKETELLRNGIEGTNKNKMKILKQRKYNTRKYWQVFLSGWRCRSNTEMDYGTIAISYTEQA